MQRYCVRNLQAPNMGILHGFAAKVLVDPWGRNIADGMHRLTPDRASGNKCLACISATTAAAGGLSAKILGVGIDRGLFKTVSKQKKKWVLNI